MKEGLNNSQTSKSPGPGTALDGSTPKKSTEQNTQHMKKGGGGIRRERRKESPDIVYNTQ